MDIRDRPNRIPWPPLVFVAAAAAGIVMDRVLPLPWPEGVIKFLLAAVGLCLVCAAVALDIVAILAFRRHRTSVLPHSGATKLITDGPFSRSRNPIYLGNTMLVAGAGLLAGVLWLLLAAPLAAAIVQKLAIEREERHLAARFGKAWEDYAARTPRWLLFR